MHQYRSLFVGVLAVLSWLRPQSYQHLRKMPTFLQPMEVWCCSLTGRHPSSLCRLSPLSWLYHYRWSARPNCASMCQHFCWFPISSFPHISTMLLGMWSRCERLSGPLEQCIVHRKFDLARFGQEVFLQPISAHCLMNVYILFNYFHNCSRPVAVKQ